MRISLLGIFITITVCDLSVQSNIKSRRKRQSSIIDKCRDVVFSCSCGNPGYQFQANFKQCHYWFPKEEACTRYQYCLECESGVKTCVTCPPNRYGRQCRGVCQCEKGAKCDRETGQCICSTSSCDQRDPKPTTAAPVKECNIPNIKYPLVQKIESSQSSRTAITIQYSCISNEYTLAGPSRITCSNGIWDDDPPTCVIPSCIQPRVPTHGRTSFRLPSSAAVTRGSGGLEYPKGTIVSYKCDKHYELVGASGQQCLENGEWKGQQPRCKPQCGLSSNKIPFIINGVSVEAGKWPWQVGIAYKTGYIVCGGSLITEDWVITAAHCVTYNRTANVINKSELKILLGKLHRNINNENVQEKNVKDIICHERYDPSNFDSDIALIQLSSSIQLTTFVQPVCLTTEAIGSIHVEPGNSGTVTGWGADETGVPSDILKETNLTVISSTVCSRSNGITVTENMFCAGVRNGLTDTCSGDSGGPMVFFETTAGKTQWYLEGIVSWGTELGCATPNVYSGFTKVHKFIDWIELLVPL